MYLKNVFFYICFLTFLSLQFDACLKLKKDVIYNDIFEPDYEFKECNTIILVYKNVYKLNVFVNISKEKEKYAEDCILYEKF
ncbi:hypothetical protein CWI38_2585p0010 [Hamiltosporidium tvaerminnensis]|uniref:Uncharacterized protein n=1 Tax=Hamiltosporidium tvaerminnensis TaxID=1176355 RepID=A0A4Q9LGV4_9MICR|nr:hypothetical protein CWI38_2585p0010 [Hamiltosporidium tvaerminnensis]